LRRHFWSTRVPASFVVQPTQHQLKSVIPIAEQSNSLRGLNRCCETPLCPVSLIGRQMLPVFCSQICLSVLFIGRAESGPSNEPITSVLLLCQLLTAPLLAWFLEYGWPLKLWRVRIRKDVPGLERKVGVLTDWTLEPSA
jgi:hypothetical protein